MVTPKKTTAEVLQRAQDTLHTAQLGLAGLQSADPRTRMAGVRNLIVFGRAVTNVLQNLRSTESTFDEWYRPQVEAMESEPLMKYLYKLRSEILKEGSIPVTSSVLLNGNPMELMRRFKAPAGAKGFFIGDPIGGSGWEVETEAGTLEKFYVEPPPDLPGFRAEVSVFLPEAPAELARTPIEVFASDMLSASRQSFTVPMRSSQRVRSNPSLHANVSLHAPSEGSSRPANRCVCRACRFYAVLRGRLLASDISDSGAGNCGLVLGVPTTRGMGVEVGWFHCHCPNRDQFDLFARGEALRRLPMVCAAANRRRGHATRDRRRIHAASIHSAVVP